MMAEPTSKSTVYVDVEDDITTIIDKAAEAPQAIVALVLPKRSGVLQSIVNMRLLKQSAAKANKKLVLVTSEAALLPLAGMVGLPVTESLDSAPEVPNAPEATKAGTAPPSKEAYATAAPAKQTQTDAKSKEAEAKAAKLNPSASIGAIADAHERKEPETVDLGEEEAADDKPDLAKTKLGSAAAAGMAKLPKVKVPNFDRFRKWLIFGGGGLLALIIFLYFALSVLPKATIDIQTTATPVSLNMNLTASGGAKKLDETNNIIPSSVQTFNQSAKKDITATGQQDIGSKATGSVTLTDCSQTEAAATVPSGTVITSSGGLGFVTESSASFTTSAFTAGGDCESISGATSQQVNVIAQSAGSQYNVGPTTFTDSSNSAIDGSSSSAMSGGSSQIVTVVSQTDLNNAITAISNDTTQPSQATVTKQFEAQLDSQGYYAIVSTLKVSKPAATSSPALGAQASTATVTVTTTYSVLAVKKTDLTKIITDYAQKQIDATKQQVDTSNVLQNATIAVSSQTSPTDAALAVTGSVNAMPIVDANSIKQSALGKKKGDIISSISSQPGIKSVDVHLSPFWVSVVPTKSSRVSVNIQAVNGSN